MLLCAADLVLKGVVRVEDINPIDEKVDMWSFGVTVYELVTGTSCAPQRGCSTCFQCMLDQWQGRGRGAAAQLSLCITAALRRIRNDTWLMTGAVLSQMP